jgi:hypothetical protein
MRFATMLVVLISLVGCAQYDAIRNENMAATSRDRVASDEAACQSSGVQPGSPQYNDCRRRLANQHASDTRGHQRLMDQMLNENNLRPIGQ